jgi:hypothetical protein
MHLWIVLAAFAFAAVTPFLSAPGPSVDEAQWTQSGDQTAEAEEERDEA